MSMFKSLQGMGGVITLFHNPASKASESLLKMLKDNVAKSPESANNGEFKYTIDPTTLPPTPEQFEFFKEALHMHPFCKKALKTAFPELTKGKDLLKDLQSIDSEKLRGLKEVDGKLFVPPLVVDWDNKLLAVTDKGLAKILDQYNGVKD
ncbi:hypothetical protein PICMEDRAFT_143613 [Pichia membranifaciens NRRL Y-2026]|uniref:Thioredoxin-like fold domain-containing protein n=1 Tax=Pichia membranifaciens NRRL Y-2026 TaxID=763406 RepID=A0A1E3NHY1_9ASCO|nr:hypothetical protein PICMEDRAFT_143613 [Pichia membranifaciens NRRL Y-2026]ODQ45696.1 hypothetical protein PICMEDRAFT_143613 [Pichia membranifaciens NRRL Y-2026]